jgi:hypothetical protein
VPDTKDPEAFMDAWMEINRRRAVAVEEVQASDQQLRAYIATVNDADQRLRVDAGPSLSTLRSAKRGTPRPARRAALSWRPRLPRVRLNVLTAL